MEGGEGKIEVNDKGVMVVHRDGCGDEYYDITKVPSDATYLVQREKKEILKSLGLQSVLKELNRASDLLYLAYMGAVGTGELHARISNRQMELSKLCAECMLTMTKLEDNSRLVLQRLTEAYKYLLKANETRALKILSRCAENAGEMSASCANLAVGFGKLADDTQEDAATAARALGQQVAKVHELKTLRDKMQANKLRQEAESKLLYESIQNIGAEIKYEKAREEVAEKRAFISSILGSVLHTVTLGYARPKAYKVSVPRDSFNHQQPSGGKDVSKKQIEKWMTEERDAKEALEEAKSAKEQVLTKERDSRRRVLDATFVKEAKQKRLDAAIAGDKAKARYEEKVQEAETELDASTEKLAKLQFEQNEAEKDLVAAQKTVSDAAAAVSAAAESLESITQPVGQMSQAQEISSNGMTMIAQKLKMEELRRESIGLLEELTSLLDANTKETSVEESAQVALEIAGWALSNVFAALSNAKLFWDNMKMMCEKLAKSDMIDKIKDEVDDGGSAEDRIEVYRSEDFVRPAVSYVAKWAALTAVCGEYVKASELARQSVLSHIKAAPSIEEARRHIGPLKVRLLKDYEVDAGEIAVKIDDLKAEVAREIEGTGAQISSLELS